MINPYESLGATGELVIGVNDPALVVGRETVNEHLNTFGADYFIDIADNAPTDENGMQYAVVGEPDSSQTEVLMMPGTFANGLWPHMAARAKAVAFMAQRYGVTASDGAPLSVLLTASPGMLSRFGLDRQERSWVARGSMKPIARRHLELASDLGYGVIGGMVGYSQAAAIAAPFMNRAPQHFDVGNSVTLIAEPPHALERSIMTIGQDFKAEDKPFKPQRMEDGIDVIEEIFARKVAAPDFIKGVLRRGPENLAIVNGFKRGLLLHDLVSLLDNDRAVTLLHTTDSRTTPRDAAIEVVQKANNLVTNRSVKRIEVTDTTHAFGDRVGSFATLAAVALQTR